MPKHSQTLLAPFAQKPLFELVNNLEDYPQFMPFCVAAKIIEKKEDLLIGSITLQKGPLSETFTTKNTLYPYEKMVLTLVDGPFKHLEGIWTFTAKSENCTLIQLDLDYAFNSMIVATLFGSLFQKVAANLMDNFYQHAQQKLQIKG